MAAIRLGAVVIAAGLLTTATGWMPLPRRPRLATRDVAVREVCEVLDAIQGELLSSRTCSGQEPVEVGISWRACSNDTLLLVYRVPGRLQVFREAYLQKDGTVWLADDLVHAEEETRSWIRPISDERFKSLFEGSSTRICTHLAGSLTDTEQSRQAARDKGKAAELVGP